MSDEETIRGFVKFAKGVIEEHPDAKHGAGDATWADEAIAALDSLAAELAETQRDVGYQAERANRNDRERATLRQRAERYEKALREIVHVDGDPPTVEARVARAALAPPTTEGETG